MYDICVIYVIIYIKCMLLLVVLSLCTFHAAAGKIYILPVPHHTRLVEGDWKHFCQNGQGS